jgi:hypothetical protein
VNTILIGLALAGFICGVAAAIWGDGRVLAAGLICVSLVLLIPKF